MVCCGNRRLQWGWQSRHSLARAAGDRAALHLVYRDTATKLFGICLRILRDQGEAEDVLQEVNIAVWQRAGTFDPRRASPITWLVTIARNRAIDRLRASGASRRTQPIEDGMEVSDPSPSAVALVETDQEYRRLKSCFDELDPQHGVAIRSAFLDGATYEELTERMSVPLGTMKSWIRRSLMRLRACLEQ